MSSLENDRLEFNLFMRKVTGDARCIAYSGDAKNFMRLLVAIAPVAAVRELRKEEWEPLAAKAGYMLAKMFFDRRPEIRSLAPSCLQAIAFRTGKQEDLRHLLLQMTAVSEELAAESVEP